MEIEKPRDTFELDKFCLEKVLNQDNYTKSIVLLGNFGDASKKCVLIIGKAPFKSTEISPTVGELFTPSEKYFENDIFRNFTIFKGLQLRELDAQTIYPATEKMISKYSTKEWIYVEETPEFYYEVTLPLYVQKIDKKNYQWIYDVLDKKAEAEDIIYEDPDPEKGFILSPTPPFKKPDVSIQELHVLALTHNKSLTSLRDLNQENLGIIENIYEKGMKAICEKYKINKTQIKSCIHYLPTYFHLHIHFAHVSRTGVAYELGKAVSTRDVIQNIKLKSDYYQKATLNYFTESTSTMAVEYLKRINSD